MTGGCLEQLRLVPWLRRLASFLLAGRNPCRHGVQVLNRDEALLAGWDEPFT
jgi:hypothetical protein